MAIILARGSVEHLAGEIADFVGKRYVRLTGRGTTAQVIALRALALLQPLRQVLIPDLICTTVLDGVLLAGLQPLLAEVTPRFTIDIPSASRPPTHTAAIVAHTFGHCCTSDNPWYTDTIEDMVQGIGGQVGQQGRLAILGFHETKMIGGRGGAVLTDDVAVWEAIQAVDMDQVIPPPIDESFRYATYRTPLMMRRAGLLLPFEASPENIALIRHGIQGLPAKVRLHNERAAWLSDQLAELPLSLPPLQTGDAIWRYTFAASNRHHAQRIKRALAHAHLKGSDNYPALSTIFTDSPNPLAASYSGRLINICLDESITEDDLHHVVSTIHRAIS